MIVLRHRIFVKQFKAFPPTMKHAVLVRLSILLENEYHPSLNNHALQGELRPYRSINISGDIRLIYEQINQETIMLRAVDTHHQLYRT